MFARALAAFGMLTAAMAGPVRAFVDHPLPGHDGFDGGPSCRECHTHRLEKAEQGRLTLDGLPQHYTPGQTYALVVRLEHPDLATAGFQAGLHPRQGSGGTWRANDHRTELMAEAGIDYVQHSPDGTRPDTSGVATWRIEWTAPRDGGEVAFALAANAANDDQSALGDVVLLLQAVTFPEQSQ